MQMSRLVMTSSSTLSRLAWDTKFGDRAPDISYDDDESPTLAEHCSVHINATNQPPCCGLLPGELNVG